MKKDKKKPKMKMEAAKIELPKVKEMMKKKK